MNTSFVTRYNIFKLFQMLSDSYSYRLLVICQYIRYLSGKDLVVSKYASKWKSLRYRCANTFCNIVYLCNYCFVFVHCTFDFKHCSLTPHFCRFFKIRKYEHVEALWVKKLFIYFICVKYICLISIHGTQVLNSLRLRNGQCSSWNWSMHFF